MATQNYLLDTDANGSPLQGTGGAVVAVSMGSGGLTLTTTPISLTSSGSFAVLTPTAGMSLRVAKLAFVAAAATVVTFLFENTVKSGSMPFSAGQGFVLDGDSFPFKLAVDQRFVINISVGGLHGFAVSYQE